MESLVFRRILILVACLTALGAACSSQKAPEPAPSQTNAQSQNAAPAKKAPAARKARRSRDLKLPKPRSYKSLNARLNTRLQSHKEALGRKRTSAVLEQLAIAYMDKARLTGQPSVLDLAQEALNDALKLPDAKVPQLRLTRAEFMLLSGRNDSVKAELDAIEFEKLKTRQQARHLVLQGRLAGIEGRTDEALGLYRKALRSHKRAWQPHAYSATLFFQAGKVEEGNKALTDALAVLKSSQTLEAAWMFLEAGRAQIEWHSSDRGIEKVQRARQLIAGWWQPNAIEGQWLMLNRKDSVGVEMLDGVLKQHDDLLSVMALGLAMKAVGQNDRALVNLHRAADIFDAELKRNERTPTAAMMSYLWSTEPSTDKTLGLARRFYELRSDGLGALVLGRALLARQDAKAAAPLLERAYSQGMRSVVLLSALAQLRHRQGQKEKAKILCEQANTLIPRSCKLSVGR